MVTPSKTTVKKGDSLVIAWAAKNTLTKKPPIVIDATATYEDPTGTQHVSEASTSVDVVQPRKLTSLTVPKPIGLSYVSGSAALDGSPITITEGTNSYIINVNKELYEGESSNLEMTFSVQ